MATIKISCETQDAKIMYTTDDSEPTESSNLYSDVFEVDSPVTIKARAFKEGYEPSDIATKTYTPVTVPMALPDGSVLFYDRGSQYGEYSIGDDGYPVRLWSDEDDGSAESLNWRYLICDSENLSKRKEWGLYGTDEGLSYPEYEDFGYGLPNTEALLSKYGDSFSYIWQLVQNKRNDAGGKKWFVPSKDELNIVYENKDTIVDAGGGSFQTGYPYWSASGYNIYSAWSVSFSSGTPTGMAKNNNCYCRLLRRI